jgi:threonine synthase
VNATTMFEVVRKASFSTLCTGCGRDLSHGYLPFCPACNSMADVFYDLTSVELRNSKNPYVRFIDLLPVSKPELLPADAKYTPTVHARKLGAKLGIPYLYLKDETGLPTGTTKDRMAAIALAYLRECGVRCFTTSSTGNSSSAYAHAIARIPDIAMYLFTASAFRPRLDLPDGDRVIDVVLNGATFVEAFDAAGEFAQRHNLVAERGFFNPGRREGLKLAWLEAAEQVPGPIDWYVQAVSSAMGVYGVYKAARELHALGLSERLPRLLCVQQESCAPMVSAWNDGADQIRPCDIVERPSGIAEAILRGNPTRVYPHVRRIVTESSGSFLAVSEQQIISAKSLLEQLEGISTCYAAAAALAGLIELHRQGGLPDTDTVLVNLTGGVRPTAQPTPATRRLERSDSGWDLDSLASSVPRPAGSAHLGA